MAAFAAIRAHFRRKWSTFDPFATIRQFAFAIRLSPLTFSPLTFRLTHFPSGNSENLGVDFSLIDRHCKTQP